MQNFVLTSTSVTDGHPDKLCDRISDAIVDAYLARDPAARVNAECAIASGIVFLATHAVSSGHVDFPGVVRSILDETGYREPDFNAESVTVLSSVAPGRAPASSPRGKGEASTMVNATLFGYACRHTAEMLPMPIALAHDMVRRLRDLRCGELDALHPDGQAQVAVRFIDRRPVAVESVTLSSAFRHDARIPAGLFEELRRRVVEPALAKAGIGLSAEAPVSVNPENGSAIGGPLRHAGLTGRKTDIDTYGGFCRHAGAALSGKDPSRIDRTGAYAARLAARTVVAAELATECEVQISYCQGRTHPVSVEIDTFGSGQAPDDRIGAAVRAAMDFDANSIRAGLRLFERPAAGGGRFFTNLAAFGHMGRMELDLPWEASGSVDALLSCIKR
ncbi:MAG: methionine adenosyltransferase domain-containing protein [Hyphomicrobiaceae bacterium]|nr:methionine adenosyltransferase domain-containing protein [Hyphomicrobiaceae bacterium]